jgi:hypothetical protein
MHTKKEGSHKTNKNNNRAVRSTKSTAQGDEDDMASRQSLDLEGQGTAELKQIHSPRKSTAQGDVDDTSLELEGQDTAEPFGRDDMEQDACIRSRGEGDGGGEVRLDAGDMERDVFVHSEGEGTHGDEPLDRGTLIWKALEKYFECEEEGLEDDFAESDEGLETETRMLVPSASSGGVSASSERFLRADIISFTHSVGCDNALITGRTIARIFHGIQSPAFTAVRFLD